MKAEISMFQIFENTSIQKFFMREQAIKTFNELIVRADKEELDCFFDMLENYVYVELDNSLDDFEEMLYNESIDDIWRNITALKF